MKIEDMIHGVIYDEGEQSLTLTDNGLVISGLVDDCVGMDCYGVSCQVERPTDEHGQLVHEDEEEIVQFVVYADAVVYGNTYQCQFRDDVEPHGEGTSFVKQDAVDLGIYDLMGPLEWMGWASNDEDNRACVRKFVDYVIKRFKPMKALDAKERYRKDGERRVAERLAKQAEVQS